MRKISKIKNLSGLLDLASIPQYQNGGETYSAGRLVRAIKDITRNEEYLGMPKHKYDFTQSEEWANAHGYFPDERGHRDDRVKKPSHPTHPSRGIWKSINQFDLSDKGIQNVNHTLFGLNDGGQDPQTTMTYRGGVVLPEITVTPKGNYIYNSYDNINIIPEYKEGGYTQQYYDERRSRARWDTSIEQLKNLLSGFNKTFGTAAAGASLISGGGWALNRLLRRNHPSILGQKLAPLVLPANAADTTADIGNTIEDPNRNNLLDLATGLILGRFRNLGKPARQAAELVGQSINANNMIDDFAEGGIHIKKKNRGKFTKSAKQHGMGVQEYARKVVNDLNATTLQKRRAQFAINARKFKH